MARLAVDRDVAAQRRNDATRYREAQSGAETGRLGAEEGVALETIPHFESYLVAAIDAALAAQNATVAAESLGLSMVYIGALRNDPIEVGRLLELPSGAMGVSVSVLATPAERRCESSQSFGSVKRSVLPPVESVSVTPTARMRFIRSNT